MQLYKLTNSNGNTKNNTHWGVGIIHSLPVKQNPRLCSGDVFHAYTSPLLAALMNPGHANYKNPLCFTTDGEIAVSDGTKVGCFSLVVTGFFVLPDCSKTQQTAFGILSTLKVYKESAFVLWAYNWLDGKDRSSTAAYAASTAAYAAYAAAAYAAYAAYASYAAAYAAAADAASYAAAAADAAAADAAAYAVKNGIQIDFQALAEEALKY
jgi:hypothetical protein